MKFPSRGNKIWFPAAIHMVLSLSIHERFVCETENKKNLQSQIKSNQSEYPMDTLLMFFFYRFFLDTAEKNQKPFFFKCRESFPSLYIILNGAQNFKFIGFIYATLIGLISYTEE